MSAQTERLELNHSQATHGIKAPDGHMRADAELFEKACREVIVDLKEIDMGAAPENLQ